MADVEKMKINLTKNEEKLAKKVALLAKYENKKAKLSADWEKLTNQTYEETMEFINSKDEELSIGGKLDKYYSREVTQLYFDISTFYDYSRYSWNPIVRTQEGIDELKGIIKSYQDKIAEEEKKVADRKASIEAHTTSINGKDVNVIIEFLNNWENKVTANLMNVFDRYINEADEWFKANVSDTAEYKFEHVYYNTDRDELEKLWATSEYVKYYPTWKEYDLKGYNNRRENPCYNEINDFLKDKYDTYEMIFSPKTIEKYAKTLHKPNRETYEKNMRTAIAKEKDRKYDQLIDDVEHICGTIIDMTHIKVGVKGDLEGYVIGTNGEAELWTTGCGGFNENVVVNVKHGQCFHFRFYVRKRA